MNPTVLQLRQPPPARINAACLAPDSLAMLDSAEIAAIPLPCGRYLVQLGELFSVHKGEGEQLRLVGDLSRFDRIGYKMNGGSLHVEGSVGDQLGAEMHQGTLTVTGNAGDLVAASMKNGQVVVQGSVGNCAGGPLRGQTTGMRGGRVKIGGNSGYQTGYRLRRGTLMIAGDCGDQLGAAMIAGTIIALGKIGSGVGQEMRRGTLLTPQVLQEHVGTPRFSEPLLTRLGFLSLLLQEFPELNAQIRDSAGQEGSVWRSVGDRLVFGQGELLAFRR